MPKKSWFTTRFHCSGATWKDFREGVCDKVAGNLVEAVASVKFGQPEPSESPPEPAQVAQEFRASHNEQNDLANVFHEEKYRESGCQFTSIGRDFSKLLELRERPTVRWGGIATEDGTAHAAMEIAAERKRSARDDRSAASRACKILERASCTPTQQDAVGPEVQQVEEGRKVCKDNNNFAY
ncbi:unnamed protein product [Amoebophrya sp. A120]|nr:unnamed protein product [Amoebophrya sp. A120]|eukprot:GSA120T00023476001.1